MKRRLERLARIERLAQRLSEMAQWRLAEVAREREALTVAHTEMIAALGEGWMAFGPLAIAGTRRIRAIEGELRRTEAEERNLMRQALVEARRAKLAQRVVADADAEAQGAVERRDLENLIERAVGTGPRKT